MDGFVSITGARLNVICDKLEEVLNWLFKESINILITSELEKKQKLPHPEGFPVFPSPQTFSRDSRESPGKNQQYIINPKHNQAAKFSPSSSAFSQSNYFQPTSYSSRDAERNVENYEDYDDELVDDDEWSSGERSQRSSLLSSIY